MEIEWISGRYPSKEELEESYCFQFLCIVEIPERGGTFSRDYEVISFDILDKCWECDGVIVTHWAKLPELPDRA